MHLIKKLAIGLAVALTMASFVAASASASQRSFAAGAYPASVTGVTEGTANFSTDQNAGSCEMSVVGQLSSASPIVQAEPFGKCEKQKLYAGEIKNNGCKLEFNSDFNTVDIGPAGCGPISVTLGTCTTYFLPQNGIPATYEATTVEGLPAVRASISTNKLKYKECSSAGAVKENGSLQATLVLRAQDKVQNYVSLSLTSPSYTNYLSAEKYPASLVGTSSTGAVIKVDGQTATCGKVSYAGTLSSVWEDTELVPTFSECVVFGYNGVVSANGCKVATSVATGYQEVICPEGKAIVVSVTGMGCEATIGSQGGLTGAASENATGANGRSAVRVKSNMSGVKYTVTKDSSIFCPLNGVGTRSTGTFTDDVLVEGQDSAGPIAIKIGA